MPLHLGLELVLGLGLVLGEVRGVLGEGLPRGRRRRGEGDAGSRAVYAQTVAMHGRGRGAVLEYGRGHLAGGDGVLWVDGVMCERVCVGCIGCCVMFLCERVWDEERKGKGGDMRIKKNERKREVK